MRRSVQNCQYRQPVESISIDSSRKQPESDAHCSLLADIIGISHSKYDRVSTDICQACCDSFPPTSADWNSVVASQVFQASSSLIEEGGHQDCSIEKAQQLSETALESIPIVNFDEDDCADDIQQFQPPSGITLDDLLQILPLPSSRYFPGDIQVDRYRPLSWSVAITTAPRRQSTLQQCVDSLLACGWSQPKVFVDGTVEIPESMPVTVRKSREVSIGAWPAWRNALETLVRDAEHGENADVLMIVQDDTLFPYVKDLREYVDQLIWPQDGPCLLSLYTSADDTVQENLWQAYRERWSLGALTVAMSLNTAQLMLESIRRDELEILEGTAGIDTRIGYWAERNNVPLWHPSPSLVQHVGQVSAIWAHSRAVGLRRAGRFIADEL